MAVLTNIRSFERWGYSLEGWFNSPYELAASPGVFVVATQGFMLPFVIDVDESVNVQERVLQHDRRAAWRRNALGSLMFAVIYTEEAPSSFLSEFARQNIVQHIRSVEQPVCGSMDIMPRHAASA